MPDESHQVLILGNDRTPEMQPVVAAVGGRFAAGEIRRTADVNGVAGLVKNENWFPDLVVVCQNQPDEFSELDVRRLFETLPLARWICCYGLWCESDGRNRTIWPAAVRIPAWACESRIQHEFSVLRGEQPALPATGSRDEIFAYDYSDEFPVVGTGELVQVKSCDLKLRHWIQDLLTPAGYRVVSAWEESVTAVIWDADPWNCEMVEKLRNFNQLHLDVGILAVMNFAHPEDLTQLGDCGADAIVAKLVPQTEFLTHLRGALRKSGPAIRSR